MLSQDEYRRLKHEIDQDHAAKLAALATLMGKVAMSAEAPAAKPPPAAHRRRSKPYAKRGSTNGAVREAVADTKGRFTSRIIYDTLRAKIGPTSPSRTHVGKAINRMIAEGELLVAVPGGGKRQAVFAVRK